MKENTILRTTLLAPFLALTLAGCGQDDVDNLDAQPAASALQETAPEPTAPQEPAIAPEDTATRTVREAIRMRLAFVEDSVAKLPQPDSVAADSAAKAKKPNYRAGEDPDFAREMGWPVVSPKPLPGAILPDNRILCYYGNPNSTRMGALGEFPKDEMLAKLKREVEKWNKADPEHPVKPCLHMVSVVAQGDPGTSGKWRAIALDKDVQKVYDWAKEVDGIFFVDIQVGTDDIRNLLPRFDWILKNPDVHIAVDPEFMMKGGERPGSKIGTMDAADINYVTDHIAKLVREHNLPPKVLVLHRFTRRMITNYEDIKLRPEVQIVIDMDGWGAPWLKRDSYRDYIVKEPVEYTGFKIFYHNDSKKGDPIMQPADVLKLHPKPLYIQYQ